MAYFTQAFPIGKNTFVVLIHQSIGESWHIVKRMEVVRTKLGLGFKPPIIPEEYNQPLNFLVKVKEAIMGLENE